MSQLKEAEIINRPDSALLSGGFVLNRVGRETATLLVDRQMHVPSKKNWGTKQENRDDPSFYMVNY